MKTLITLLFLTSFAAYAGPHYTQQQGDTGPQGIQGVAGQNLSYMPEVNLQFSEDEFSIAGGGGTDTRSNSAFAVGAGIPLCRSCNAYAYGQYKSNLSDRQEAFAAVTWRPGWTW